MHALPHRLFGAIANPQAPVTLTGTQYSRPVKCGGGDSASFHLKFAGTPTTAITIWTTNIPEKERDDTTDADWVQETTLSITGPAGAALNVMVHVVDIACEEIRMKLVTSGGSGTVLGWGKVGG